VLLQSTVILFESLLNYLCLFALQYAFKEFYGQFITKRVMYHAVCSYTVQPKNGGCYVALWSNESYRLKPYNTEMERECQIFCSQWWTFKL